MLSAYMNRGNTYHDLKRDHDAMKDYERVLEIDPEESLVHLNIGVLLANRGDLEAALPYFEQAACRGVAKGATFAAQVKEMLQNRDSNH
jgi:tetratricopeptide (TPR) repeat protein